MRASSSARVSVTSSALDSPVSQVSGNSAPPPGGGELGDFACGKQLGLADELGSKGDFCEVLERFHAEEGGEQVGPAGGGTMIGEKERVVVRHVRLEYRAQIWRARGSVADERDFAETDDHFREKRLIEAEARDGETRGGRRMAMANRVDIGAHAIKKKMHGGFGRDFAVTLKMRALHIHDDEVLRRHHAFVDTGGRGEN